MRIFFQFFWKNFRSGVPYSLLRNVSLCPVAQLVRDAGPDVSAFCSGCQAWLLVEDESLIRRSTGARAGRRRRQVLMQGSQPKKNKGQTQTQFIAFGNTGKEGGTAEAVAGADGTSRSTVSKST